MSTREINDLGFRPYTKNYENENDNIEKVSYMKLHSFGPNI